MHPLGILIGIDGEVVGAGDQTTYEEYKDYIKDMTET
jgi:hypothetical protein